MAASLWRKASLTDPGQTARFSSPQDLTVDAAGVIFIADTGNNRITRGAPEPLQPTRLANVSTRARSGTGDNNLIGGFIVGGTGSKELVVRGMGPSLGAAGVSNALSDPMITVVDANQKVVATNDDWTSNSTSDQALLQLTNLAPPSHKESALVLSLPAGAYTAVVRGVADTTGICLVEIYDVDPPASAKIANLSPAAQ